MSAGCCLPLSECAQSTPPSCAQTATLTQLTEQAEAEDRRLAAESFPHLDATAAHMAVHPVHDSAFGTSLQMSIDVLQHSQVLCMMWWWRCLRPDLRWCRGVVVWVTEVVVGCGCAADFVYKELIPKGGGGSGWVPQRGRFFKFDFPSAKFWVKIFLGVGGSQSQKTPPPLINKVWCAVGLLAPG